MAPAERLARARSRGHHNGGDRNGPRGRQAAEQGPECGHRPPCARCACGPAPRARGASPPAPQAERAPPQTKRAGLCAETPPSPRDGGLSAARLPREAAAAEPLCSWPLRPQRFRVFHTQRHPRATCVTARPRSGAWPGCSRGAGESVVPAPRCAQLPAGRASPGAREGSTLRARPQAGATSASSPAGGACARPRCRGAGSCADSRPRTRPILTI